MGESVSLIWLRDKLSLETAHLCLSVLGFINQHFAYLTVAVQFWERGKRIYGANIRLYGYGCVYDACSLYTFVHILLCRAQKNVCLSVGLLGQKAKKKVSCI